MALSSANFADGRQTQAKPVDSSRIVVIIIKAKSAETSGDMVRSHPGSGRICRVSLGVLTQYTYFSYT